MSGDMSMHMHKPMAPPPMDHNMGHMDMMAMSFYWGKNAVVLFEGWPGHSLGMYIISIFFVFFLSFGIEIFSLFQSDKPSRLASVLAQTGFYALKTALTYLVMLAVMSFNIGILLAAALGHALGFLVVKVRAMLVASRAKPVAEAVSNV